MAYQKKGGHGGKRDGAGRKDGTPNALEYGEAAAVKAAKLRLKPDAPEEAQEFAALSFKRICDVMMEKVSPFNGHSRAVLAAATRIREEVCGPLAQKVEHSGADGAPLNVTVVTLPPEGE